MVSAVSAELDLDRRYMTVVEMSELSTGDREVPEGCKAQITHVIFDCDGLMLGRLVKFALLRKSPYITRHYCTKFAVKAFIEAPL